MRTDPAEDMGVVRTTAEEAQRYIVLLRRTDLEADVRRGYELRIRSLCAKVVALTQFVREGLG